MRINHNISALNAYRNLAVNNANTAKSLEKLSSGLRINKASDDAAGLAISEKMRSQIRGLEMAERNALDGISLIQTAEGALSSSHEILQRMRELAVQAANDSYTNTDRAEIQKEVNQLTSELNRIGNSTEFNNASLLDGSRTNTFSPNGKGFAAGGTSLSNPNTGLTMAITNGDELAVGKHTVSVTRELAGTAQPDPITPSHSDLFVGGRIEADTSVAADNWTLTYQKGTAATVAPVGSNNTGVTVNVADGGTNLAAGEHTVNVIATPVGVPTFNGETSYQVSQAKSAEVTVTSGTSDFNFTNGSISYNTDSSTTLAVQNGQNVTLTYNGSEFEVTNGVFTETYHPGTEFNNHGLNFTLEDTGFNPGDAVSFTIGADPAGTISTVDTDGYTTNGAFTLDPGTSFTVNNEVGTGDWTITRSSTGYDVAFSGTDKDGKTLIFNESLTDPVTTYNNHGLEFNIASSDISVGDSIELSTTKAVQEYNYSIEVNGETVSVPNGATTITDFEGLSLDVANLQAGTFKFTVDPAVADKFQLNSVSGKTADVEVGQLFEGHGLSFLIDSTTGLNNGENISFSTVNPVDGYNYYVSLDGKEPILAVENQSSPAQIMTNTDLPGLHLSSTDLKEGTFSFDIVSGQNDSLNFQIGANAGQTVALEVNDMRAQALEVSSSVAGEQTITLQDNTTQKVWFTSASGVNDGVSAANTEFAVDVTTHEKAQAAITVFSDAIQQVSSERARLGSIQNRLEHTVSNLKIMTENVTSSESRIRDLDMAKEMSTFTKNNILNQAAQAMLSQANQMPQGVLQLLK